MSTRIQIKRGTTNPSGLTTGEFAYNVTNSTLYIGNTADQKWIGGEVTGGVDMGGGSAPSQNRVPTQNAVYQYARNNFVHRLNGITGGITLNAGANITITSSVGGGITIASSDTVGVTAGDAVTWTQLQRFPAGISAHGATLSGTITAPTQAIGTNNTTVATTAFVQNEIVADTITSFNGRTGAVQGVSAAVAGNGISVSGATGAVTITNTGVTRAVAGTGIGLNANTGTVTITNTGVQSFNGNTGSVTGASLGANTFTGLQTSLSGFSGQVVSTQSQFRANVISIGSGIYPLSSSFDLVPVHGFLELPSTAAVGGFYLVSDGPSDLQYLALHTAELTQGQTISFPNDSGTVALTKQLMGTVNGSTAATTAVTSFNGRTGAVQGVSAAVAGDGISVSGATGAVTITNTGVTRAVAGTGIGLNANTGTVTITNNGVTQLTAGTAMAVSASTGNVTVTNIGVQSAVAGNGISVSGSTGSVTFTNTGVTRAVAGTGIGIDANTGTVTITNNGVQSFNGRTGAVQGVSAAVAGDGISVSGATGSVTITNSGVTRAVAGTGIGLNANTGTVTITNNGVLSFNGSTGVIQGVGSIVAGTNVTISPTGGTGAVTINSVGVTSTAAYTWSSAQTFNGGVTASRIDVTDDLKVAGGTQISGHVTISRGVTVGSGGGILNAVGGITGATFTATVDVTGAARFNGGATASALNVTGVARLNGGVTASTLDVSGTSRFTGTASFTSALVPGISAALIFANTLRSGFIRGNGPETITLSSPTIVSPIIASSSLLAPAGGASITLQTDDGDPFSPTSYNYTISAPSNVSANQTFNLPSESGTFALRGANTFTGLQTLTAGLSAAGGITLNGTVAGATATFSRLLTANAGISASGITLSGNSSINFTTNDGNIDADSFLRLGQNSTRVYIGDAHQTGNATYLLIRDNASILDIINPSGDLRLGDPDGINNGVFLTISNTSSNIEILGSVNHQSGDFTSAGRVTGQSGVAIGAGAISAKTSGYTLTSSDNGKVITFNSASAVVCGVGTASGATGFSCTVIQLGTGGVRFARSGVTLNSYNGLTLAGQHAAASLVCYQTNVLNVSGNLVS